jgi:hypothetical protein
MAVTQLSGTPKIRYCRKERSARFLAGGAANDDALRKNHVPSWFLVAADEGHGYAKKANQDCLFAAWAEFVQEYFTEVTNLPGKRGFYRSHLTISPGKEGSSF